MNEINWVTSDEFSEISGLSLSATQEHCRNHNFHSQKIDGVWWINESQALDVMQNKRIVPRKRHKRKATPPILLAFQIDQQEIDCEFESKEHALETIQKALDYLNAI